MVTLIEQSSYEEEEWKLFWVVIGDNVKMLSIFFNLGKLMKISVNNWQIYFSKIFLSQILGKKIIWLIV